MKERFFKMRLFIWSLAVLGICIQTPGCTFPLHDAVRSGNAAEVSRLVAAGADTRETHRGRTALLEALRRNETEIALVLIERGSAPDAAELRSGSLFARPIFYAVSLGNKTLTEALLAAGAGLEDTGCNGMTPLMEAARTGHDEILKILIARGADVEARDHLGRTALIWSALAGHEVAARTLLESGADPGAKDDSGRGAASYASILNRSELLKMLRKQQQENKQ